MKVIIAGTRTITNSAIVVQAVALSKFDITEVVCGCAKGVDALGEQWALKRGIPVKRFPAEWQRLGKSAGFVRNAQMARYADALIAITTGSPGTSHMIQEAQRLGLPVFIAQLA